MSIMLGIISTEIEGGGIIGALKTSASRGWANNPPVSNGSYLLCLERHCHLMGH